MSRWIKPLAYLVAGLIAAGGFTLGYKALNNPDDSYQVTAYFEKAIGLFPNSDVTILGVAVGKVESVEPEGLQVKVVMNINKDYKVPADAFAQIVPISVISDRYVQLAPVYEEGEDALEDGAVLQVEDTQIPAELDDVFKQLKKLLDAIEPGQPGEPGALGDLVVQLNETLRDREQDLQGTLIHGATLTNSLSEAKESLSGILVNLDDLFGQLATRSSKFGSLNANLVTVLTTLAESRDDLEGTLANLARMTDEVGSVVAEHGDRLGQDLHLAARITAAVLRNRASVEESLTWLPVVGEGVSKAYHGAQIKAVDVRDNAASARCDEFEDLPDAIKDALEPIFDEVCAGPPQQEDESLEAPEDAAELEKKLNCDVGVRRVKRQLRRVAEIELPEDVKREVLRPLRKQLRKLARECDEAAKLLEKSPGSVIDEILEDLGGIPELDEAVEELDGTNLSAGADVIVPQIDSPGFISRLGGWFGGLFRFIGGSS